MRFSDKVFYKDKDSAYMIGLPEASVQLIITSPSPLFQPKRLQQK